MRFKVNRCFPNRFLKIFFPSAMLAIFMFLALAAALPVVGRLAEASGYAPVKDPVQVDPDLILAPVVKIGKGPLIQRAVALADDPDVRIQLKHLLTEKRQEILDSLSLSTRYLSHMVPILKKYDLPPELAYLCVIESGYRQSARSYAGAVGMWQMIRSTSRRFNLRTDAWMDQRLDFVDSTEGAAKFLKYLQGKFDDWDHILAAYNAGEGRVKRALTMARKAGLEPEMGNLRLPRETRIYVPAFYAALLIAMEPQRYGLFPDYEPPLEYFEIQVPGGVPLSKIAQQLSLDVKELKTLNPAILKGRVPVAGKKYSLRIPCSVEEETASALAASLSEVRYVSYRVRKGDTLWDISRKFGVSISKITRTGSSRGSSSRIFPGEMLLVTLTGAEGI